MSWKKAVFFGGAVLVLAACSSATAPTPTALSSENDNASARAPISTARPTLSKPTGIKIECSSIVIHVGDLGSSCLPGAPTIDMQ